MQGAPSGGKEFSNFPSQAPHRRKRGRPRKQGLLTPIPRTPIEVAPLVPAEAIAELLSIPQGYVYDLAKRGEIPFIRVGKYLRFSIPGVIESLKQRCVDERKTDATM